MHVMAADRRGTHGLEGARAYVQGHVAGRDATRRERRQRARCEVQPRRRRSYRSYAAETQR